MSYLYLEPEILKKLFLRPASLHDVFCLLFREHILQEKEKKTLILDTRRILRNYQKLSFEEKELFSDCPPYSDAFFLNVVMLFQLRNKEIPTDELKAFYFRRFKDSYSDCVKERNFSLLLQASASPFVFTKEIKEFREVYLSLLLEVPSFLIRDYEGFLSASEEKNVLSSYWKKPKDFYLPSSTERTGLIRLEDSFLISSSKEEDEDVRTFYPFEIALSSLSLPRLQPKVLLSSSCPRYAVESLSRRLSSSLPVLDVCVSQKRPSDRMGFCHYHDVGADQLLSRLRPRDYDLVLVMGKDNRLSYNDGEFLLPGLTKEKLEDAKTRILQAIRSYSGFVKKGGYLVYVSESVSSYETILVRNSFLSQYGKEFESIRSRFSLPSEVGSRAGYFMIFRRIV